MEENIIKVVHCKTKDIFNQRFAEINVSPEEKDENPYYYYVIIIQDTGEVYTHGKIINSDTLNKLKTLIGNDSDKSARKIAEEEISKVIDNAPEMYDTLQEIAAWIEEHGDEVTEINNGITTNAQNISTISKHIAWNATDIIPNYKYYITKSEFIAEHPDYQNENSVVYNDIVYVHNVKEIYTHGRFYNEYATFDYTEFEGGDDVYVSEYVRQTSTIASIINNYGIIPVQIKNEESFLGIGVATIYIDTKSTVKSILCKTIWLDNWTDSENQKHVIFKAEYNEDGEVRYELIQKDYVFANHKTSHLIAQELTVNDQKLQLDGSIDTYVKGNGTLGKINEFLASDGVAKFANDLTGRNEATTEEFTFRPSAGNKSIRDDSATIKRIKGNSIVWNQLARFRDTWTEKGLTATNNGNEIHISGTVTEAFNYDNVQLTKGVSLKRDGRKYLVSIEAPTGVTYGISCYSLNNSSPFIWSQDTGIDWGGGVIAISVPLGTTIDYTFKNPIIIDLTQMFGVGNEPDTVEEFIALFPGNHYEYNPGQLVSMTANGLFTNGFNQWDEEWELGYLNADGTTAGYVQNHIRAKNYIPVISGAKYYAKLPNGVSDAQLYAVDENYNLIEPIYLWGNNQFFIPDSAAYIRFYMNYGSEVYNNDICINLSHTGVENGKYEPYWDATKDLSIIQKYFPNGMRSAGSIYDEISFDETTQKWVAIQRVGTVDLGSLSWFASTATPADNITNQFFYAQIDGLQLGYGTIMISAPYDEIDVHPGSIRSKDKTIYCSDDYVGGDSPTAVIIRDSSYNDTASFKTAMSGIMLNYELAEPIITVIEEPINLSYKVGDFGIEQILSDSFSAPFRADIIYQFNATDRIRENSLNIEKLSKTQNECLLLAGGTMSGQINSQDIKPIEDSTYQLGDSTHKYDNVFSNFFTGNLEGNAKTASDLTGRIEATPEVFTYHPSAGEKSIKDDNAFIRRVKGNSVIWNQLVDNNTLFIGERNGMVISKNEDGSITFNGTASADIFYNLVRLHIPIGHKVALTGVDNMSPFTFFLNGGIGNTLTSSGIVTCSHVITNENRWMFLYITANTTFNNVTINPKIHYLTRMFGIGNEPNTIEEFRALYPDSYYPYNAGELRNLDCSGIKTVGFNEFNGTYARVLPNVVYYLGGEYTSIAFATELGGTTEAISLPSDRLYIPTRLGYIYASGVNININLHHTGWRDGEYEPYKEVTHSLPLSQITNGEPLRKAGSVYDEINETHYIKRVGVVDLGSLSWIKQDRPNSIITWLFRAKFDDSIQSGALLNMLCDKYITDISPIGAENVDDTIIVYNGYIYIEDTSYTNVAALEQALSGVMLNYELAEPIVTPIETPIDFNYYVEDFGTEEALLAEDSAPFSADIIYQFNATDQIRNNSRNIHKLEKSAFAPKGTSSQYIRGDGSYGNVLEFTQAIPINDGEYEMPDAIHQFILTPNYYAKSPVELDNTTTVTVYVTPPEDSNYLAEYWFEFKTGEVLPDITFTSSTEDTKFRIAGDMLEDAVNILHLTSSDGGMTFFGEMKHYIL